MNNRPRISRRPSDVGKSADHDGGSPAMVLPSAWAPDQDAESLGSTMTQIQVSEDMRKFSDELISLSNRLLKRTD